MYTLPTPVDALDQIKNEIQNQETTPANDVPASDTPTPTTYTILINYQFANGTQAAPSWSATVATGSTYTQDIQSPVVVGYTASETVVHVNTSEAKTYTVTYQPAEVEFTVKHYQQNVSNDEYTLVDTETKKGFTESAVGENLAKTDYTGFYSLLYDTTTAIAADGSTVVEVYYDRYYYLVNFNLDGGYGVEPIYARYGATISVDTPTNPGYTFVSWTPSIPSTMPAENTVYTAKWEAGWGIKYTVVYWGENANDDEFGTLLASEEKTSEAGASVSGADHLPYGTNNQNYFTYKSTETKTVAGDGSTVVNVYFTRNKYKVTFDLGEDTRKSMTVNGSTYRGGGTKYVLEAKFEQNIETLWPTESNFSTGSSFRSWSVKLGNETSTTNLTSKRITMTEDLCSSSGKTATAIYGASCLDHLYYMFESFDQTSPVNGNERKYEVGTYYDKSTAYSQDANSAGGDWGMKSITGMMAIVMAEDVLKSTEYSPKERNIFLYYDRLSYNLKFHNYNGYVNGKGGKVKYEAPLSSYSFTPEYPDSLEPNVYVFDGWYTTAGCYEGSKVDLSTMTMPASDLVLYAKWVPKTHTVKTYLTKVEMDEGKAPTNTWPAVPHGTAVTNPPADPTRDPYKFVGWFYISDTGVEKAFDFPMPVNRDLNLYAKWSSNTLMEFEVRYELENGTEIAQPFTGSALAGSTKTFNAKTGTQLNKDYQSGYFPKVSSHSITIDIADASKNKYTFVYVAKDEVEYTVRYLDKATGEPVVVDGVPTPDKVVKTRDAVVTETFKQITGYAPDAYQKQLVLAAEDNKIIFWYVKDDAHAPVRVIHWQQNLEGDGYTERQSSTNLNGVIGTEYSEEPLTISGFRYNGEKSNAKGTLTAEGLVLNLYYDRIEYPYAFKFLEQGTDKVLAEAVTGNARYQKLVAQKAKDITGYTLVSAENQSINIAIEEGTTAVKNVKTFYYTEQTVDIKYEVVGPDGCGTLDNYQDAQLKVMTGTPKGSTPTANPGFKFVGWFMDENCVMDVDGKIPNAVDPETNKLTPQKRTNGYHYEWTYYAKFEYDVADLTISKSGCAAIDENQSFIFTITGEDLPADGLKVVIHGNGQVKVTGLKVGITYTVTEDTGWSWRYTPEKNAKSKVITLMADATKNKLEFINVRTAILWLNGCSYKDNQWAN